MRSVDGGFGRALALGIAGLLWAAPQAGAAASPPAPTDAATVSELVVTATKTVAELTVTAPKKCLAPDKSPERAERPRVVSSYPAKGAVVRPGLLVVRVTFSLPMACDGAFTSASPLPDPCPGSPRQMLLSYDRRTIRTVCIVAAATRYGLQVSEDPTSGASFMGLSGLPSFPYRLDFTTSAEPAVTTVCAALAEDADTARKMRELGKLDCESAPAAAGD